MGSDPCAVHWRHLDSCTWQWRCPDRRNIPEMLHDRLWEGNLRIASHETPIFCQKPVTKCSILVNFWTSVHHFPNSFFFTDPFHESSYSRVSPNVNSGSGCSNLIRLKGTGVCNAWPWNKSSSKRAIGETKVCNLCAFRGTIRWFLSSRRLNLMYSYRFRGRGKLESFILIFWACADSQAANWFEGLWRFWF